MQNNTEMQLALEALSSAWSATKNADNPFSNTGASFEGRRIVAHAYSWSDDNQEFNFAWRDFRATWYKYLGRSTEFNRALSAEEIRELIAEGVADILGSH